MQKVSIATFRCITTDDSNHSDNTAYVVDVKVLTGERVFSSHKSSFRSLLEDPNVVKVTFDCRSDSDALFHQFGVTIQGVLDIQILDQAVRINSGEDVPHRNPYIVHGGVPFLEGMSAVATRSE